MLAGTDEQLYTYLADHVQIHATVVIYKRVKIRQQLPTHFEHEFQKKDMLVWSLRRFILQC